MEDGSASGCRGRRARAAVTHIPGQPASPRAPPVISASPGWAAQAAPATWVGFCEDTVSRPIQELPWAWPHGRRDVCCLSK